jgi:arylsulfatase A-like enzyme
LVLITLDTTRADRLGCYGRTGAGTPNLDKLAAGGVRFAEAWSPAPITLPAHLSMMTGCTPVTHGVRDNGITRYDGRIPTLANRFSAAGYRTVAVVSASVLDSVWAANAGFGVYDERFDGKAERSAAAATTRALELLGESTDPFFLWVHYFDAVGQKGDSS